MLEIPEVKRLVLDLSIERLFRWMNEYILFINPNYKQQWDNTEKSLFIDTCLKYFRSTDSKITYLPFTLVFFELETDETRLVVKGQEEILAFRQFINNEFTITKNDNYSIIKEMVGHSFNTLPKQVQEMIHNCNFRTDIIYTDDMTPEQADGIMRHMDVYNEQNTAQTIAHAIQDLRIDDETQVLRKLMNGMRDIFQPQLKYGEMKTMVKLFREENYSIDENKILHNNQEIQIIDISRGIPTGNLLILFDREIGYEFIPSEQINSFAYQRRNLK